MNILSVGMQCTECRYNCHEKCVPHVPKNCTTRLRPMSEVHTSNASIAKTSVTETASNTGGKGAKYEILTHFEMVDLMFKKNHLI